MAMQRGGGKAQGWTRGGSGGKAVLLIELKHRILAALHKLSDRDTQQLAVEELERIAQGLTSEGIALFLACLYDTDAQQKSVVRRECIKLVGTLATLHGDVLGCHLPKMVGNIVRRLKDPDSNIRDACVETIGTLASQTGGGEAGSAINVFVKPLFEALGEQNRNLQVGASLCLARVIECTKDVHVPTLQRICPRVVKLLANPNFLAKASLLTVVGGLVQVPGVVTISQLPVLISAGQEELDNSEWAVRKAAADTLTCMATALGPALAPFKAAATAALENCRFDKVKPVRDSVSEALQLWKAVNDPGGAAPGSHDSASPNSCLDGDASTPSMTDGKNSLLMKSGVSVNASYSESSGRSKSAPEKRISALKKRTPALSDKKTNPDFFRKLETARNTESRESGDWQIEVAVPRVSPQEGSPRTGNANCGNLDYHGNSMDSIAGSASPAGAYGTGGFLTPKEITAMELRFEQEGGGQLNKPIESEEIASIGGQGSKTARSRNAQEKPARWGEVWPLPRQNCEFNSWDATASATSPNSVTCSYDKGTAGPCPDWGVIHRQFHSLERQQLSIMEMLQDSMVRVHESMQDLEGRVCRLEHLVDDMAQSVSNADGRLPVGGSPTFQGGHPLGKFLSGDEFLSFKAGKEDGEVAVPSSVRSQDSLEKMTEFTSEDSDEFAFGSGHRLPVAEPSRRANMLAPSPLRKGNKEDVESEQVGIRRVCERGSVPIQQGEGPSARSVWQASKDEATLAAIRGAALPYKPAPHQKYTSGDFNSDHKSNNRVGGGPFWMLWSRAMENVRAGDLDVAYGEILGSGDELLLVRMMGRTGPVLQQLSPDTVLQLMGSIKQLLQQQSFLDCIIPWVQQVSDLVSSNGADSLGLTSDMRKELVMALQDATSLEFAESWIGAKISELAEQLGNAWSDDGSALE